jgi:hypothetical protein
MNCPSCGTPAATAGATHCRRCGAAFGGKKAAPAAAASSSSDDIELMPLEESKAPAHSEFEPPPGLEPPPLPTAKKVKDYSKPPDPTDPRPRSRAGGMNKAKSRMNLYIGAGLALLVVGYIGYRFLRTKHEIIGRGAKVDQAATIQPGALRLENFEVNGVVTYSFDVTPQDGDLSVGLFHRAPGPISVANLKKLPEGITLVKKGDTNSMSAELMTGQYSWGILNETKKLVRVKVKFSAQ